MSWKSSILLCVVLSLSLISFDHAAAQPSVASVTGNVAHGDTITVSGTGFGGKTPAAPLWWDDCEGATTDDSSILTTAPISHVVSYLASGDQNYTEIAPTTGESATESPKYRTSWHGVAQPHDNSTTYLTCGHIGGSDVGERCYVVVSPRTNVTKLFVFWRLQLHPEWNDVPAARTANYKELWIEDGSPPSYDVKSNDVAYYSEGDNWPWNTSITEGNMGGLMGYNLEIYHNATGNWVQREMIFDVDNDYHSYSSLDGNTAARHSCSSCNTSETGKAVISIGSYGVYDNGTPHRTDARMRRYFDDIYVDTTLSRIMLCNNATYNSATICEPQIPSAWGDGSITCRVNLGKLPATGVAYLFVFDSNNDRNPVGYLIEIGAENTDNPPSAPKGLEILPEQ